MSKVIVYTREDGCVSLVHPNYAARGEDTEGAFISKLIKRHVPAGASNIKVVDASELPQDKTFRNAWKQNGSKIEVDMNAAREIQKQRIRQVRDPILAALDVEYIRAQEENNITKQQTIVTKKNELREAPSHSDLAAAASPEELKVVFPAGLDNPDSIISSLEE